jgi:acetyl esterase/lipase
MPKKLLLIVVLLLGLVVTLHAQDDAETTPEPEATAEIDEAANSTIVEVAAEDGLLLTGEYFTSHAPSGRTLLLLHQLYTNRSSWYPVIEAFREAGYDVLAVDLRGHGATRGAINWGDAQDDTLTWVQWLQDERGAAAVFIAGSSMGSNLAIVGCDATEICPAAVAVSPGRNYHGVSTDEPLQNGLPVLIVYADRDTYPRCDVPRMVELEGFAGEPLAYEGREHGMQLFETYDDLLPQILDWLAAY